MKVTQHRPDFIDSDEPPWRGEVASIAQLSMLPFVTRWWAAPGFYQFSVARRDHEPLLLMAEFRGGMYAYVVARISGPDALERLSPLPEWVPKQEAGPPPPPPAPMSPESIANLKRTLGAFLALVTKLEQIGQDPEFVHVFTLYSLHGGRYGGPTWEKELSEAQAALCEAKTLGLGPGATDPQIPGSAVSEGTGR